MPNHAPALPPATVHELVRRHADGPEGDTTAMVHGTRQVTYRELDAMTLRMADALGRAGVGRGDFVGIRLARSPQAVAAMLGVLRAGAAYVPIDLADPVERVRHVTGTAGVSLVVTGDGSLPGGLRVPALPVDEDCRPLGPAPRARRATPGAPDTAELTGEDIAYALFTSGSTGAPKGALMTHGALVNLLTWHDRARPGSCRLRTAQVCSLSFDFSFHEIFSTLGFGGTLVFADDEVRRNPFALLAHLSRQRVARLFLPVPLLDQVAQAAAEESGGLPRCARSSRPASSCARRRTSGTFSAAPARGCTTTTAQRSSRTPPPTRWTATRPPGPPSSPSGSRSTASRSGFSTRTSPRCRWARRANSASWEPDCPPAMSAGPTSRHAAS